MGGWVELAAVGGEEGGVSRQAESESEIWSNGWMGEVSGKAVMKGQSQQANGWVVNPRPGRAHRNEQTRVVRKNDDMNWHSNWNWSWNWN